MPNGFLERFYQIGYGFVTLINGGAFVVTVQRQPLSLPHLLLSLLSILIVIEDFITTMQYHEQYRHERQSFIIVNVLYLILLAALSLPLFQPTQFPLLLYPALLVLISIFDILYCLLLLPVIRRDDIMSRADLFSIVWVNDVPSLLMDGFVAILLSLAILTPLQAAVALGSAFLVGILLARLARIHVRRTFPPPSL